MNLTRHSQQKERDSEAGVANSQGNKNPRYYQRRFIYLSKVYEVLPSCLVGRHQQRTLHPLGQGQTTNQCLELHLSE